MNLPRYATCSLFSTPGKICQTLEYLECLSLIVFAEMGDGNRLTRQGASDVEKLRQIFHVEVNPDHDMIAVICILADVKRLLFRYLADIEDEILLTDEEVHAFAEIINNGLNDFWFDVEEY